MVNRRLAEEGKRWLGLQQPSLPDLDPRVHVVVDVVVFQHAVSVVIEIHPNLEKTESCSTPPAQVRRSAELPSTPHPSLHPPLAHLQEQEVCFLTCLPLWMRFLRRTGVLPVVTHTPASVLL